MRIAQRFNAGMLTKEHQVPKGRLTTAASVVPSGLSTHGRAYPALNRWAILTHPFGMNLFKSWWDWGVPARPIRPCLLLQSPRLTTEIQLIVNV